MKKTIKMVEFLDEYQSKYDTKIYNFVVTFDDNTNGVIGSTTNPPKKFKSGDTLDLEKTGTHSTGRDKYKIVTEKKFTPATSGYDDPVRNKAMAMGMSIECAKIAVTNLGYLKGSVDLFDKVTDSFFKWICKVENKRDILSHRWYALRTAVEFVPNYLTINVTSDEEYNTEVQKIFINAEHFYHKVIKQYEQS